jgi:hypothetical protein
MLEDHACLDLYVVRTSRFEMMLSLFLVLNCCIKQVLPWGCGGGTSPNVVVTRVSKQRN